MVVNEKYRSVFTHPSALSALPSKGQEMAQLICMKGIPIWVNVESIFPVVKVW